MFQDVGIACQGISGAIVASLANLARYDQDDTWLAKHQRAFPRSYIINVDLRHSLPPTPSSYISCSPIKMGLPLYCYLSLTTLSHAFAYPAANALPNSGSVFSLTELIKAQGTGQTGR